MKATKIISLYALLIAALSIAGEEQNSLFTLPEAERGTVLRRSFWDSPGYQLMKEGESGPGILITCPPAEEKTARYKAIRLSGRLDPAAHLKINGKAVRIYPTGSFVDLVPLELGKNLINFTAEDKSGKTEYVIELHREEFIPYRIKFKEFRHPHLGRIARPHTPLQLLPGRTRLLTLNEGTVLKITGRGDEYLQVELADSLTGCLLETNVEFEGRFPKEFFALGNAVLETEKRRALFFAETSVPARVDFISPSEFKVIFSNSVVDTEEINLGEWEGDCRWEQEKDGEAAFHLQGPLSCYRWSLNWKEDAYQLSWKDRPRKNEEIVVLIDPGHGGEQPGAVSPLGIEEKEANLLLAHQLARSLIKEGIKCVLSRGEDISLDLQSRVNLARQAEADLLLSIHYNSLPEDEDPRGKSGCTVFYYNPPSRELAGFIYRNLKSLGLKGNGVRWKSLAVIRPTDLIGVLVEVSYLTNPEDEARILDSDLRRKCAATIANAVGEYLKDTD